MESEEIELKVKRENEAEFTEGRPGDYSMPLKVSHETS